MCLKILMLVNLYCTNLDKKLVLSIIRQESNFKNVIGGGSVGLMQILPSTARAIGCEAKNKKDLLNEELNIKCGCLYLTKLSEKYKKTNDIIASYNAGAVYKKNRLYVNQSYVDLINKWRRKDELCYL